MKARDPLLTLAELLAVTPLDQAWELLLHLSPAQLQTVIRHKRKLAGALPVSRLIELYQRPWLANGLAPSDVRLAPLCERAAFAPLLLVLQQLQPAIRQKLLEHYASPLREGLLRRLARLPDTSSEVEAQRRRLQMEWPALEYFAASAPEASARWMLEKLVTKPIQLKLVIEADPMATGLSWGPNRRLIPVPGQVEHGLTEAQQAALLLVSIHPEIAGRILRGLSSEQVTRITRAMAQLPPTPASVRAEVFNAAINLVDWQELNDYQHFPEHKVAALSLRIQQLLDR